MNDDAESALWAWTLVELLVLAGLVVLLAASVAGLTDVASERSLQVRLAAILVLGAFLLAPVWVYSDVRRREDASAVWVHAVAMPLVNLLGLVAYLHEHRQRPRDGHPDRRDSEADP